MIFLNKYTTKIKFIHCTCIEEKKINFAPHNITIKKIKN